MAKRKCACVCRCEGYQLQVATFSRGKEGERGGGKSPSATKLTQQIQLKPVLIWASGELQRGKEGLDVRNERKIHNANANDSLLLTVSE